MNKVLLNFLIFGASFVGIQAASAMESKGDTDFNRKSNGISLPNAESDSETEKKSGTKKRKNIHEAETVTEFAVTRNVKRKLFDEFEAVKGLKEPYGFGIVNEIVVGVPSLFIETPIFRPQTRSLTKAKRNISL